LHVSRLRRLRGWPAVQELLAGPGGARCPVIYYNQSVEATFDVIRGAGASLMY